MAMQYVRRNIRPELAEDIRQGVAPHRPPILHGDCAHSPIVTGVIRGRDALRDAPPEDLGSVERIVAVVVRGNQDTGRSIDATFEETALAHGIVALVLMQNRWQCEDYEVIAIGFID